MEKQLLLPIYNLEGKSVGTVELNPTVFGVTLNPTLLHQAIVAYLANRRATTAHTKDRGEVAGSNKKPWRQKGTGHARHGSSRSPIWRGGGTTFGPKADRNYTLRLPQKMRQAAMKMVLSDKVAKESLIIVDSLSDLDGKTKSWVAAAKQLPKADAKVLVVGVTKEESAERAMRNVPTIKYVGLDGLNIFDISRHGAVIMTKDAVEGVTSRFVGEAKVAA